MPQCPKEREEEGHRIQNNNDIVDDNGEDWDNDDDDKDDSPRKTSTVERIRNNISALDLAAVARAFAFTASQAAERGLLGKRTRRSSRRRKKETRERETYTREGGEEKREIAKHVRRPSTD